MSILFDDHSTRRLTIFARRAAHSNGMAAEWTGCRFGEPGISTQMHAPIIIREQVSHGPSPWSTTPAVKLTLQCEERTDAKELQRWMRWLSSQVPGIRSDGWHSTAQAVQHLACALGAVATGEPHEGSSTNCDESGRASVVLGYTDEEVALASGRLAVRILTDLASGIRPQIVEGLDDLRRFASSRVVDPSTSAILEEADTRGIPHIRVGGSMVQLGQGIHQLRVRGSVTSLTSALAAHTASNDALTNRRLRSVGLGIRSADTTIGRPYRLLVVGGRVVAVAERSHADPNESRDCTLQVHPDNVQAAELAARVIGFDVLGVDLVLPDIRQSLHLDGGIVGFCANPDLTLHTNPTAGEPRFVAEAIIDLLFPPGGRSRIPTVAVTGTNGKTTTTRMIAHILGSTGRTVGMTTTDGIFIGGRRIAQYDASGPKSAQMVLQHPRAEVGVFEVARGGILREGLGYDHNDVAVVLNVAPDHLGQDGVNTIAQLADVKRVIVDAVPAQGTAVLNANDPLVVDMAHACRGSIIFFSTEQSDAIDAHNHRGGGSIVLEHRNGREAIVFREGRRRVHLLHVDEVPATFAGRARMNIENALAAAGATLALGTSVADVREGLRSFETSYGSAPGRLNVTDLAGAIVVVDYAHNPPALRQLGGFVDRLADSHVRSSRRLAVIGTPGDRRLEDAAQLGSVAAQHFDVIAIFEGRHRGRPVGETAAAIRNGINEAVEQGARCTHVEVILDQLQACERVLSMLNPGDVVALCIAATDDVWQLIERRRSTHSIARLNHLA